MSERTVSELFDPAAWRQVPGFEDLQDLTYHRAVEHGTVRIAFDRPEVRNAFRPGTVDELLRVLEHARISSDVGCVILTGNGPSPKDGGRSAPAATSGSGGGPATTTPTATPPTRSTRRSSAGCTSSSASG